MSLGYRDPMTFKKLPMIDALALGNHVLTLQQLSREFHNEAMHQYIHELMHGDDPRESDWFKRMSA